MAELTDIATVREEVRERYAAAARVADESRAGCGCGSAAGAESACCDTTAVEPESRPGRQEIFGEALYEEQEVAGGAETAVAASLGCGVPTAVADLHDGEVVLDLGSGAGADVLISARRVAPTGKAIGIDMTDEMIALARRNADEAGVANVDFVKGYIEELPLADARVEVVISNCVINLSGDKKTVLHEASRVI
jgi:arsenite methyltransferase